MSMKVREPNKWAQLQLKLIKKGCFENVKVDGIEAHARAAAARCAGKPDAQARAKAAIGHDAYYFEDQRDGSSRR